MSKNDRNKNQSEDWTYRPAGKLEGRTAIITGGDSGIGRATCLYYVREGADVAIVYLDRDNPDAQDTKRQVEAAGRRCLTFPGNVGARLRAPSWSSPDSWPSRWRKRASASMAWLPAQSGLR